MEGITMVYGPWWPLRRHARMNVLLLNTYDWGGAGTATTRIHRGLRRIGVDSRLLVANRRGDEPGVIGPAGQFGRAYAMARIVLDSVPLRPFGPPDSPFSVCWLPSRVHHRIQRLDPELVHLNWVGDGFLNVKDLRKFGRPIVWRLPDMWALTGGCHYSDGCDRFEEHCGRCPRLGRDVKHDPTWWTLRRKRKAWTDLDITVVAPSTWLADQADRSAIFGHQRVEVIPNGLDTETFKPYDQAFARDAFDLPTDRQLLLFGSINPTSDARKGFGYLRQALRSLADTDQAADLTLVVFGAEAPDDPPDLGFETHYVGYLDDDVSLALLYAAADVMVVPSKYEGFGQTVTEAQACGTPVVAFDATGPKDTVVHKETGYLAEPYDPKDFAAGIIWVVADAERRTELSAAARERTARKYSLEEVAKQYRELYRGLLG